MRLRSILSLFLACCSPVLVAQTLTVGNVHARVRGFAAGWVAGVTYIDLVHPAPADGTLTRVSFEYAVWGSCHDGVKIRFFRREGDVLTMIAERSPFDGPSFDVALSPPVDVRAGDLIGLVRLGCPFPNLPGSPVFLPADQGEYLAFDFDVTRVARASDGMIRKGTLLLYATGEAAVPDVPKPCSLQTFAGSYAFYEKGSSAIFDPDTQPYPNHWAGALAPFITVGRVTMGSDGVGDGNFWIRVGSLHGGLEPIPVVVTITEMNDDCTGKFTADFDLHGQHETILERFILFDGGREFRAIPIGGGPETLAWIMEGHRISKPGEPVTCGPQTAKGKYVWAVENLLRFDMPYPMFTSTMLLHIDVAMNGEYTGTLYEKMGPMGGIELPVRGTVQVNPDCTFTQDVGVVVGGVPFTDPVRGVFFDGGKRAFVLSMNSDAIGMQYSFGQAVRVGQ